MTERIDLSRADDPRDVVHRAVACLAQGGVVGLATESTYGILGGIPHPSAIARLAAIVGDQSSSSPGRGGLATLFMRGLAEISDWAEVATETGRRLAARAWPGAVTLVFPVDRSGFHSRVSAEVGRLLVRDGAISLRIPSNKVVREIIRFVPCPLIEVAPPVAADGRWPTLAEALTGLDGLDMILDVGRTQLGGPSTVVAIEPEGWSIVRAGVVAEDAVARMAGTIILFVCTGNTCRSPMAEALCKTLLARKLGCESSDLIDRGYVILSAGVSAMDGMPAAANAIEVVRSRGGALDDHASQRAVADLVRQADQIIAMTADHLDTLLDRVPEVADRTRLLDRNGDDIDDPVGSDLATYHRTAREIEGHLSRLLDDLGL